MRLNKPVRCNEVNYPCKDNFKTHRETMVWHSNTVSSEEQHWAKENFEPPRLNFIQHPERGIGLLSGLAGTFISNPDLNQSRKEQHSPNSSSLPPQLPAHFSRSGKLERGPDKLSRGGSEGEGCKGHPSIACSYALMSCVSVGGLGAGDCRLQKVGRHTCPLVGEEAHLTHINNKLHLQRIPLHISCTHLVRLR